MLERRRPVAVRLSAVGKLPPELVDILPGLKARDSNYAVRRHS
jgi:hypothetical protein